MQIINVMASSIDGKIALHDTESDAERRNYGFTNKDDQEFVRSMLETADAVVTGAKSLRASGGAWQVRNQRGKLPAWIVLTTSGIAPDLKFWDQRETERWLVSPRPLPGHDEGRTGVRNLVLDPSADPAVFVRDAMIQRGFSTVLLFGGGAVNRLFYRAGLVDELRLTICPIILATKAASSLVDPEITSPVNLRLDASHALGSLVFLKYAVLKN